MVYPGRIDNNHLLPNGRVTITEISSVIDYSDRFSALAVDSTEIPTSFKYVNNNDYVKFDSALSFKRNYAVIEKINASILVILPRPT